MSRFSSYSGRLLLLVLFLAAGCDDKKQRSQQPTQMVGAVKVVRENVPLIIEAQAKITGSLEIQVRAQVSGILKSRLFHEGQFVNKGDKLFEIDQEPYKAALKKANGTLAQAQSEMRRTTRDYDRMKKLYKDKAVSQKDHDDALAAFERAEANLKVAEGLVKEAEINLGYTEVRAPISGVVRKEAQSVGNLISLTGDSSLLTTMVQVSPLHANFSVSGEVWSNIAKSNIAGKVQLLKPGGYAVEVIMSDGTVYPYSGKIIFIDSSEDNFTSSVSIKAEIPSDDHQRLLLPGQFVRVRLVGAEYTNALVIPTSAIVQTEASRSAYVVGKDKVVQARSIKAESIGNKAIVDSGLQEGEVVISEGIMKARPGQPINAVLKVQASK
ncbi:MAG: efflux RND transporter periplasmic adaptor subunit [Holosporaceae bacterium]|jgi:membrane fusion protein (multidrug efflux system)|nr:efflux RND transporter periplasmic adaptor subunit [Holosporaceae bacterium]